jgi:sigma-B regulation protein RsbU (phosphoserine phosphatase)
MLQGRLATLIELRPHFQSLALELKRLRLINEPLNSHFVQVDEEMQLASRLQRDFLPRELPQIPGIRFATIFRPATWVSGDIYDIMRLDEDHVGFYVADAVGHGMPAALLTMFIKRALVTKQITGSNYTLVEPGVALAQLNGDLVAQELSNFQFATCCYGILNTKTLRLRVANAGHPAPMRINRQAQESELDVSGSLLGVFPNQTYETKQFQLHHGEKLIIYSDGVELAFVDEGPDKPLRFRQEVGDLARADVETMCTRLVEIIEHEIGSLHPRDDVTIVGVEIAEKETPAS